MNPVARRIVRQLPLLIAALWIVGIMRFRHIELEPMQYAALFAAAIALQILFGRMRGAGQRIELPPDQNPRTVLLLASTLNGVLALVLGGVPEAFMTGGDPPVTTPWYLRTIWHGGCAFAAAYCRLLARLEQPPPNDSSKSPTA